ncbi:MAG: hypothetical protein ACRC8S_15305 [Fimbriiglobus sp.]
MLRRGLLSFAFAALALMLGQADDAATKAKDGLTDGNYTISYSSSPMFAQRFALIKVETKDGKQVAEVLSAGQNGQATVSSFEAKGNQVKIVMESGTGKVTFEGTIDAKSGAIRGYYGTDRAVRPLRGSMEPSKLEKLAQKDMFSQLPPNDGLKEIAKLRAPVTKIMADARNEKDKAKVKEMREEYDAKMKELEPKINDIYKTMVQDKDLSYAAIAAQSLLPNAKKLNASETDVKTWAKILETEVAPYGEKNLSATKTQIAMILLDQEKYGKLALQYLGDIPTGKDLPKKTIAANLKILKRAQTQAGLTKEAGETDVALTKIEAELDAEYLKEVPPFKPTKYAGRKDGKANRVAVMELFTGAQCPPCVAADVGFDGLLKTYESKDVILLQYHEHIPGPDPLTNADSVARFRFYGDLNDRAFGGTPATAFNGKPAAGGGGPMGNSEKKYSDYREVLEKALEESTDVVIGGTVNQTGDDITVGLSIEGVKEPEELKLRLVLVEDNIKYVGGNGLRFHHHVVRSFLGTIDGVKLTSLKEGKYETKANLGKVKEELAKYLKDFEKNRPFPYPDRPLDLKGLKVVALVQNDKTGEIIQAKQFDLK